MDEENFDDFILDVRAIDAFWRVGLMVFRLPMRQEGVLDLHSIYYRKSREPKCFTNREQELKQD
jgi:hypothetical protein